MGLDSSTQRKSTRGALYDKSSVLGQIFIWLRNPELHAAVSAKKTHITSQEIMVEASFKSPTRGHTVPGSHPCWYIPANFVELAMGSHGT